LSFIFENVKGLLSSNGGADYKEVEKTFRELGYHMAMKVVNAKEQGTAHNRERVFVVGFLDDDDYHDFHFSDAIPLTKCIRDYLEEKVSAKYYLSQKMIDGFISHGARHEDKGTGFAWKPRSLDGSASCLRANAALAPTDNTIKVGFINQDTQSSSVFASDGVSPSLCSGTHGYAQGYIKEEPKLKQIGELDIKGNESIRRVDSADGISPALTTMEGGHRQPKILVKSATSCGYEVATENDSINFTHPGSETRRGRVGKGVAQTLDCACNQGIIDGFMIRKFTPLECFRLMGLDDSDIVLVNSDTQSYKIAGNGIEINTMRSIIRQLYRPVKLKGSLF